MLVQKLIKTLIKKLEFLLVHISTVLHNYSFVDTVTLIVPSC